MPAECSLGRWADLLLGVVLWRRAGRGALVCMLLLASVNLCRAGGGERQLSSWEAKEPTN